MTGFTCGSGLDAYHTIYKSIHGWASLFVCIFGSVANGLNVVVLTQREMSTPTNVILTGLAVADMLVMLEYIPYSMLHYLYQRPKRETFTYGWSYFVFFHSIYAQVFHTISIWLTVTLAVWRYIAVAHPHKNRHWCSYNRTIVAIIAAYAICPIICYPVYMATEINSKIILLDVHDNEINLSDYQKNLTNSNQSEIAGVTNVTLYSVGLTESARNGLFEMNFWIYSVVIKLIPCVALTILSLRLILALIEAKKRRRKLITTTMVKIEESATLSECKKRKRKASKLLDKEKQTDRTTKMLLAVLLLFLLTEFPQGILGLFSVTMGKNFFNTCYVKLGETMDIIALINSAINFILYCTMSRQFRQTFNQLFCHRKMFSSWSLMPKYMENTNGYTVTMVTHV